MASEYGWGKDEILNNVYPDELFYLTDQIKKRRLGEYRMTLAIVQNPYSKHPNELVKMLSPAEIRERRDDLDVEAMENFKRNLSKGSGIRVKS